VGEEGQTEGTLRIGPGVEIGYYEQEQTGIRGPQSVLDEVWSVTPQVTENEIRSFLGGFLFRGDDVFKVLNQLSGGEKSRVALAKLVRHGANFLVLDEPTNHLDIESREVFEAALEAFTGTVLVVSHDRYFLDRVVDHVLELRAEGCRLWEGGYSAYAQARRGAPATEASGGVRGGTGPAAAPSPRTAPAESAEPSKEERRRSYEEQRRRKRDEEKLRRRVADAEARIEELDAEKESLVLAMAEPETAVDPERLGRLNEKLKALEAEIGGAISEWERLSMRLEAFLDAPN
jgi:ATP-binding cassette subfamily F protein 3